MSQTKNQNLQALSYKLTKPWILKKITQLLLSVSVFSLFLSNYSFGPSFLHSFYFYLSTIPVQLFTHTLDKNCIFLLCNGLLVFVAKYSGLITSSSPMTAIDDHQSFKNYDYDTISDSKVPVLLEDESVLVGNFDDVVQGNTAVTNKEEKENECMNNNIGQAEDREIEELIVEDQDEEDGEIGFLVIGKKRDLESELSFQEHEATESLNEEFHTTTQEEEGEEDQEEYCDDGEGNGVLSTQELNKKFEEFIRKMKEEIRIEAQQQYVVVVN